MFVPSSCFDCKSTKNLRAIHNKGLPFSVGSRVVSTAKVQKIWEQFTTSSLSIRCAAFVVSTAKVQKIWEQFTTILMLPLLRNMLFRLQKYKKFESNSQHSKIIKYNTLSCFDCKSTKNLRAIHNNHFERVLDFVVVSTAKVQKIWEQFTTVLSVFY